MSKWYRDFMAYHVNEAVEPWSQRHVIPAFGGDVDAAFSLAVALGNDKRGAVAVAMWQAKVARPAFSAFLATAWEHDHGYVIDAAVTRRRLAAMFRYADFPPPAHLPPLVKVWRGTRGIRQKEAVQGYSWTIDRDVACWFALRYERRGQPLVITAEVPREQIAYYSDDIGEQEVLLLKPPQSALIDGTVDDWQIGSERNNERMRARNEENAAA